MLYRAAELTVSPVLRAIFRPATTGVEHVPRTGAAIIAANHLSAADEVFTPITARRQVVYFAKAEYFNGRGLVGRARAWVFPSSAWCRWSGPIRGRPRPPSTSGPSCSRPARCSASTRRAPGPRTAGCTSSAPGWPGWRCGPGPRSSRSGWSAPTGCCRPVSSAGGGRRCRCNYGPPLDFSGRPEDERSLPGAARGHRDRPGRRAGVVRPGVRRTATQVRSRPASSESGAVTTAPAGRRRR